MTREKEARTANSRFAKAGVWCFYDSEVLNSSFVHIMKFSAKIPAFAKRQNVSGNAYRRQFSYQHDTTNKIL
jgi:hypothetical protein